MLNLGNKFLQIKINSCRNKKKATFFSETKKNVTFSLQSKKSAKNATKNLF